MKRFYKNVDLGEQDGGYVILLDGRAVKTPERRLVMAPNQDLADSLAQEWRDQGEDVLPRTMPMNKYLCTAIDRVATQRESLIEELVGYGGSDQICYRAEHPADLVSRQQEVWDPIVKWMGKEMGIFLKTTSGIIHVEQERAEMDKLRRLLAVLNEFEIAALHNMTTLTGSVSIGMALLHDRIDLDRAWAASQLDEEYQIEQWGQDKEAEERRANMREELGHAARFLSLVR
ncbi:ATP12 family chaperone protein [Emcibacter sp.]|uniref:ATP12 family chaperone protein n=1 Tax=Emcibacter sp. TaxID=1979954 RepID=UPI002AA69B3C|nr:ATP12 family protein [Emcibacter sp.]